MNRILLPLTVLLANVSGLGLQLLLPKFLSAASYSVFALVWACGQFLASASFDWTRYGVLRFAGDRTSEEGGARRVALLFWYLVISLGLCGVSLASLLGYAFGFEWAGLVSVCIVYAVAQACFEGRQTLSRAFSDDGKYAKAGALRSILSLPFVVASAWFFDSGLVAVAGLAFSYFLCLSIFYGGDFAVLRTAISRFHSSSGDTLFLFRYGALVALAAAFSLLFFVAFKYAAVHALGADRAAGLIFALDLSMKAISIVGMAVNIVVSQRAIIAVQVHGSKEGSRKSISEQISVTAAFVIPAGVGFVLIQSYLLDLVVPEGYRPSYQSAIYLASVCGTIYAFRAFAIDALFVIAGRSRFAFYGPALSLVVFALGVFLWGFVATVGESDLLCCALISLVAGGGVSFWLVVKEVPVVWPIRDMLLTVAGAVLMGGVWFLVPFFSGYIGLFVIIVVSVFVYGGYALAVDLCGLRSLVFSKLLKRLR